jgi:hypothetical protein
MGESQKTEYTTVFEGDGHDMDGVDVVRLEVWMLIIIRQMRRDALVVKELAEQLS